MPKSWVSNEVRKHSIPDQYGRVWPFQVIVLFEAGGREFTMRNLDLASAEKSADKFDADGAYRVTVCVDTCG